MSEFESYPEFKQAFRALLADLLVIKESEITDSSLLVDDLDADSVSFLELTFLAREKLGVTIPAAKMNEEIMNLPLEKGLEELEELGGDQTFFEYSKIEATRSVLMSSRTAFEFARDIGMPFPADQDGDRLMSQIRLSELGEFGLEADWSGLTEEELALPLTEAIESIDLGRRLHSEAKRVLFESLRARGLSQSMGGRVPDGIDPDTSLSSLRVQDLFRFLSVGSMARYLWAIRAKS